MALPTFDRVVLVVVAILLYLIFRSLRHIPLKELENPLHLNNCYVVETIVLHEAGIRANLFGNDADGYLLKSEDSWGDRGKSKWIGSKLWRYAPDGSFIGEIQLELMGDFWAAQIRFRKLSQSGANGGVASQTFLYAVREPKTAPCDAPEIYRLTGNGLLLKSSSVFVKLSSRRTKDPLMETINSFGQSDITDD